MAEQKAKARAAWAGSGETADQAVWFDIAEEKARPIFWAMTPKRPRADHGDRLGRGRRGWSSCRARSARSSSTRRRFMPRPADRSAIPASSRPIPVARASPTRRRWPGSHPFRRNRGRRDQERAGGQSDRRSRPPQHDPSQSFGHASSARGAAPRARAACRAARLAQRSGSPALRFQPCQAAEHRGNDPRRRGGERLHPPECTGRDADHGA